MLVSETDKLTNIEFVEIFTPVDKVGEAKETTEATSGVTST